MGFSNGQYQHCDPHNHLNCAQSTNDAYPTSLHVAIFLLNEKLVAELRRLVGAFRQKGKEFYDVIKMGRTQLQDAVPMTLGQEFGAFAESLDNEISALERVEAVLYEVNMGGNCHWHRTERSRGLRKGLHGASRKSDRKADPVGV
jgi:aspartate ammonia-lyase